jgi:hypothetical protein
MSLDIGTNAVETGESNNIRNTTLQQQYYALTLKTNKAWGSDRANPPVDSTRFFFQNVNGLKLGTENDRWTDHLKFMKKICIEVSGFAETNTNWNHERAILKINKATAKEFTNYAITYTRNRFKPPSTFLYLPGGCNQICVNHWKGRILQNLHDPYRMGRWTGHTYRLDGKRTLSVITGYRPCHHNSDEPETQTVNKQH